jgi:uncharacterized OsmC-like protein
MQAAKQQRQEREAPAASAAGEASAAGAAAADRTTAAAGAPTAGQARPAGTINGVDVDRLFGTIDTIEEKPAIAKFQFRAANRWLGGGLNRSAIQGFYGAGREDATRTRPFVLDNDEPDVLLGTDQGANPVEYVLHALAGCLTTSLVYHAAARGIAVEEVESTLEGDLDLRGFLGLSDEVRSGYERVRVKFRIKADATPEQIDELCRTAQRRSPVFDIVSHGVPVSVSAERK